MSLSYDVKIFNGETARHPQINDCIDAIIERLHQAIDTYEKTPLGKY